MSKYSPTTRTVAKSFARRLSPLLSTREKKIFEKLSSPNKIQDYLDHFPINFEISGETNLSPIQVIEKNTAHCLEGAVFAATALAYHGQPPLLMDFQTAYDDIDHVIALFRQNGYWGAISKTNHSIARYRDAIYKTPRELAMSYAHEYFLPGDGRKSLRAFSKPFDLSRYPLEKWVTAREGVEWLVETIDKSPHYPILPSKNFKLRRASELEIFSTSFTEWQKNGARKIAKEARDSSAG